MNSLFLFLTFGMVAYWSVIRTYADRSWPLTSIQPVEACKLAFNLPRVVMQILTSKQGCSSRERHQCGVSQLKASRPGARPLWHSFVVHSYALGRTSDSAIISVLGITKVLTDNDNCFFFLYQTVARMRTYNTLPSLSSVHE